MDPRLRELADARPWLRSILAFIVFLRWTKSFDDSYEVADGFLEQLEKDLSPK